MLKLHTIVLDNHQPRFGPLQFNMSACNCIQLLDQKENLSLEVQQLTQDCNMHQQKNTIIQNQIRELHTERDQVIN